MISTVENELTLILHSVKDNDKKAQAFAASLPDYKVKVIDLKRDSLTETQLAEIAGQMKVPVKELVDTTYEDAGNEDTHIQEMSDEDILTALIANPRLLKTPIVVLSGGECFHLMTSYDVIRQDMHHAKKNPEWKR